MVMKKNGPGGCGCCTDICTDCTNITYFTISGLVNADCAEGCDAKNGTYVFRSVGDPIPSNCLWVQTWPSNNCGANDDPFLVIGNCGTNDASLQLISVSGGIKARFQMKLAYRVGTSDPIPTYGASYQVTWEKTFASCAAISGTLDYVSTNISAPCSSDLGDGSGDLCGLASATVSVG